MELADRVAVMERGRWCSSTRRRRCWPRPPRPFVAGFVGHATRLEGEVRDGVLRLRRAAPAAAAGRAAGWRGHRLSPPAGVGGAAGRRRAASARLIRRDGNGGGRVAPGGGGRRHRAGCGAGEGGQGWPVRGAPCRLQYRGGAGLRRRWHAGARAAIGAGAGRLPGRDRGGLIARPSRKGRRKRRCRIAAPCWRACLRPGARAACFPSPRAPNPAAMERPACPRDRRPQLAPTGVLRAAINMGNRPG